MDTKAAVKRALQTPMAQNELWQLIATAWFDKWKAYVNFDAVADVKVSRFPLIPFNPYLYDPMMYRRLKVVIPDQWTTVL
jgi:hypothetical protein